MTQDGPKSVGKIFSNEKTLGQVVSFFLEIKGSLPTRNIAFNLRQTFLGNEILN